MKSNSTAELSESINKRSGASLAYSIHYHNRVETGDLSVVSEILAHDQMIEYLRVDSLSSMVDNLIVHDAAQATHVLGEVFERRGAQEDVVKSVCRYTHAWRIGKMGRMLLEQADIVSPNLKPQLLQERLRSWMFYVVSGIPLDALATEQFHSALRRHPSPVRVLMDVFDTCLDLNGSADGLGTESFHPDQISELMRTLVICGVDINASIPKDHPAINPSLGQALPQDRPAFFNYLDLVCTTAQARWRIDQMIHGLLSAGSDYETVLEQGDHSCAVKSVIENHPRVRQQRLGTVSQVARQNTEVPHSQITPSKPKI